MYNSTVPIGYSDQPIATGVEVAISSAAALSKVVISNGHLLSAFYYFKVCLSADGWSANVKSTDVWTPFLMRIFLSKRNKKTEQLFDKKAPF